MSFFSGGYLRLAVITDVNHDEGIVSTQWLDQSAETGPIIPVPHPYAGKGGEGIFVGPKVGNVIALDTASHERYIPVSTVPLRGFYQDLSTVAEAQFDDIKFPTVESGDIVVQSSNGGQLRFDNTGDIFFLNSFSEGMKFSGDSDTAHRCSINISSPVEYKVSQAGLNVLGVVRRDSRIEEGEGDFVDFLTDLSSEQALEEIGWNPSKRVSLMSRNFAATGSTKTQEKILRNPAVIENRNITFEYAREWSVGTYQEELDRLINSTLALDELEDRRERRSNALSLSLAAPNELIENISGTAVDIFGNLLDINREVIPPPEGKNRELLNDTLEKMRHTISYHMEINTRKGWNFRPRKDGAIRPDPPLTELPDLFSSANNARDRSRFLIDIDKEGLIKANIPASSETGNIPVLSRYELSSTIEVDDNGNPKNVLRDDPRGLYRNIQNKDIFLDQIGPGGIKILGSSIKNRLKGRKTSWLDEEGNQKELPDFIEAGTAFHDITQTAAALLRNSLNKDAANIFIDEEIEPDSFAMSTEIDPRLPSSTIIPNAGGRSAVINFDGSIETSIGANTINRVSWVLDTAGALVARLGRDREGRSAVVQTDGTVALEVGGFDYVGEEAADEVDTRFVGRGIGREDSLPDDPTRFRSGKVVIRVRRANPDSSGPDEDNDDHLVIIDQTGITIQSGTRMNFVSAMDMRFSSDSRILFDAPKIQMYEFNPRFIARSGRTVL